MSFFGNIGNAFKSGFNSVVSGANYLGNKVSEAARHVGNKLSDAANFLGTKAQSALPVIKNIADAVADYAPQVADYLEFVPEVGGLLSAGAKAVGRLGAEVSDHIGSGRSARYLDDVSKDLRSAADVTRSVDRRVKNSLEKVNRVQSDLRDKYKLI